MLTKQASVSMVQRKLRVGYTRAARMIDIMEDEGIVGPYNGSKPREILMEDLEDRGHAAACDQLVNLVPVRNDRPTFGLIASMVRCGRRFVAHGLSAVSTTLAYPVLGDPRWPFEAFMVCAGRAGARARPRRGVGRTGLEAGGVARGSRR